MHYGNAALKDVKQEPAQREFANLRRSAFGVPERRGARQVGHKSHRLRGDRSGALGRVEVAGRQNPPDLIRPALREVDPTFRSQCDALRSLPYVPLGNGTCRRIELADLVPVRFGEVDEPACHKDSARDAVHRRDGPHRQGSRFPASEDSEAAHQQSEQEQDSCLQTLAAQPVSHGSAS